MDKSLTTHEPLEPQNWPNGHVRVSLTTEDADVQECMMVWIHGHQHYLHATTARELATMLQKCLDQYNQIAKQVGVPTV